MILSAVHLIINIKNKLVLAQNKDGETVRFEEIKPFARFVRRLKIEDESVYSKCIPLDCRLFFVCKGTGKIEINDTTYQINPQSVLYINSGVCYRILPCSAEYIVINFDFTFRNSDIEIPVPPVLCGQNKDFAVIERCTFEDITCFNDFCIYKNFYSLQNRFETAQQLFCKKLPLQKIKTSIQLSYILTDMAQRFLKKNNDTGNLDIEYIADYISQNYMNAVTNKSLAEIFHFHPNYISSQFRRNTGKPLHRYVIETRILNSVSLIESGKYSLTEIALMCGFNDYNYFSRCFKKYIGVSPHGYFGLEKLDKTKSSS